MYIHEATRLALELGCGIGRARGNPFIQWLPTRGEDRFMVGKRRGALCPRWQPTAEDLMADDWVLIKIETASGGR